MQYKKMTAAQRREYIRRCRWARSQFKRGQHKASKHDHPRRGEMLCADKFVVPRGVSVLVFVPDDKQWTDYETEDTLSFDKGDVGAKTVTFRWNGTLVQVGMEMIEVQE